MNKINSPFDKESILYDNHDYNYQDDPRNKCGYESIWLGLKCKDSSIIEKYKLYEIADLYKLFRYGNNEYPSLYENENVKKIINSKGDNFRQLCYEFKAERLDKDVDGAWEILPLLASIYLEICIFANPIKSKTEKKNRLVKQALEECNIQPIETIELEYTIDPAHIEYIPLKSEENIYKELKEKINKKRIIYDELDAMMWINNDFEDEIDTTTEYIKCWGCREDQPNQLAHIGENGCLGDF